MSGNGTNDIRLAAERRAASVRSNGKAPTRKEFSAKIAAASAFADACAVENNTPTVAQIASQDYKLNGGRARSNSGEFVGPRWVPDLEVRECKACKANFDWINRRHHCRHCGHIFCDRCSSQRCLLPKDFALRDPQRVCDSCHQVLAPHQRFLTSDIANHQRSNPVDVVSGSCSVRRYMNLPFSSTLGSELRKAAYTTYNLFTARWIRDSSFPIGLISSAKGLAYLTVAKVGFVFAPRVGTGLVIARLPDGRWSAPTAIGTVGLSWGFQGGASVTDFVLILNSDQAVRSFSGVGQVTVGAGVEVAVGPVGRSGSAEVGAGDAGFSAVLSYSQSRGLFAGVSLEGSVILSRPEVNYRFYGKRIPPLDILSGEVQPPRAAQPLYDALREAESTIPSPTHLIRLGSGLLSSNVHNSPVIRPATSAALTDSRPAGVVNSEGSGQSSDLSGWKTYPSY